MVTRLKEMQNNLKATKMNNSQRKARRDASRATQQAAAIKQQRIINVRRDQEQQAAKAIPHNESDRGSMNVTKANKEAVIRVANGSFRHHNVSVGGGYGEGKADMITKAAPYRNNVIASQAKRIRNGW